MPKNPTVLSGKGFASGDKLSTEIVKSLVCQGPGEGAAATLGQLGWWGKFSGCIILNLSNDNERVERGCFSLVGSFPTESILFQAIKLWPEADSNVYLSIDVSTSNFLALPQTLVSDYIDSELLEYSLMLMKGEAVLYFLFFGGLNWQLSKVSNNF